MLRKKCSCGLCCRLRTKVVIEMLLIIFSPVLYNVHCTWNNLFTLSMTFEIVTDDLWGLPSVLSTVVLLAVVTACTGGDDIDDVTVLRALLCTVFGRVLDVEVVVTTFRVSPKNKIIVRQFFNGASCKLIWQGRTLNNIKHYFST